LSPTGHDDRLGAGKYRSDAGRDANGKGDGSGPYSPTAASTTIVQVELGIIMGHGRPIAGAVTMGADRGMALLHRDTRQEKDLTIGQVEPGDSCGTFARIAHGGFPRNRFEVDMRHVRPMFGNAMMDLGQVGNLGPGPSS
jgi:hypothetical protein